MDSEADSLTLPHFYRDFSTAKRSSGKKFKKELDSVPRCRRQGLALRMIISFALTCYAGAVVASEVDARLLEEQAFALWRGDNAPGEMA